MLKVNITDPAKGIVARVVDGIDPHALVVATRPLKTFSNRAAFFVNPTYGININQNASAGGTPEQIHNGLDDLLWTGSNVIGSKAIFNSALQFKEGSQSVLINNPNINDIVQFAKGSDLDLSDYVSFSMWVYVESDWGDNDSISMYGWDTGAGISVGTSVFLEDYFTFHEFGVWHKVNIPLSSLELSSSTIDALRIQITTREGAKSPRFFLDVIQFEETGNLIEYIIKPKNGTWYHVTSLMQSFADAYDGTLINATMPNLSYEKILGETLVVGYTYAAVIDGKLTDPGTIGSLGDMLQFPNSRITSLIDDGTNVFLAVQTDLSHPFVLKSENDDYLTLTIQEDLTGFLQFRFSVNGFVEDRLQEELAR